MDKMARIFRRLYGKPRSPDEQARRDLDVRIAEARHRLAGLLAEQMVASGEILPNTAAADVNALAGPVQRTIHPNHINPSEQPTKAGMLAALRSRLGAFCE